MTTLSSSTKHSNWMQCELKPRKMSPVAQEAIAHYLKLADGVNPLISKEGALYQRAKAIFENWGFPTQKDEDWKYTRLTEFVGERFELPVAKLTLSINDIEPFLPDFEVYSLVFVDGIFASSLSDELPEGVTFQPAQQLGSVLEEKMIAGCEDLLAEPFALLNLLLAENGYVLEVSANIQVDLPLFILHIQTQPNTLAATHNIVRLAQGADVAFIEQSVSLSDGTQSGLNLNVTEWDVADNARAQQVLIQKSAETVYYFDVQYVKQSDYSRFHSYYVASGAKLSRHQNHLLMAGDGIESEQNSTCIALGHQLMDSRTDSTHAKTHGISKQLHKFILTDQAQGVFDGMIYVDRGAVKTDGEMDNRNLILSETARMNAKPKLEIYTDDVKCSHGSATGQMDKDQVFYLQARGIRQAQAVQLITQAFAMETLEEVAHPQLKQWATQAIQQQLDRVFHD